MSFLDELRTFLEERLIAMDPNVRVDEGSPAATQLIEPTLRRFAPDPFEMNLEKFIKARLAQEYPQLAVDEGSAIVDLLVKPAVVLLEPFRREIRAIARNQSLADPDVLNADEADAILNNIFIKRNTGEYARGKVRAYFQNPLTVNIGSTNVAYTAGGLRYIPSSPQSITMDGMLFNQDGDLYYFDINYVAEAPGGKYNVGRNEVIGITALPAASKVRNLSAMVDGDNEETTVEMIARGEESIGERSLTTIPGIVARLYAQFPNLQLLNVIGYNDAEMGRDIIKGGAHGDVVMYGLGGDTADDGDGDGYTPYFDITSPTLDFTTQFGPVGTDLSGYLLTVWYTVSGITSPHDFVLKQVESATQVSIADTYTYDDRLPDNLTGTATWEIRTTGTLTLSDIPGGILFPDSGGTTVEINNDEVHVGGCTDFYVKGSVAEEKSTSYEIVADRNVIVRGLIAQTFGVTTPADQVTLTLSEAQFDSITVGVTYVRLISGSDIGSYRIVSKGAFGVTTGIVYIDTDLTADASNVHCEVVDDLDIDLLDPREVRLEASDLRAYAGLDTVDNAGTTDYTAYSVVPTDYLVILNGDNAGEYEITGVAANELTIDTTLSYTESPLQYRVIRKLTDSPMELPLLRIRSVELLDSSLKPRGEFIPYRHPVDVQSRRFANVGREPKAGTSTVITNADTLSSTSGSPVLTSSNTSISYYALGVRAGDVVNILTSDNQGYYTVQWAGGDPDPSNPLTNDYDLQVTENLPWTESSMNYAVGEPSVGSFRAYFLEPCTFQVDGSAWISTTSDGTTRRFRPDPSMWHQYLPTDDTIATSRLTSGQPYCYLWEAGGATNIKSWDHGVAVGDRVEFTYAPLAGDLDIETAGGVAGLDGKSIRLNLGSGAETIVFSATGTLSIDEIISQINSQASISVASKIQPVGGQSYLTLRSVLAMSILDNSGAGANDATADIFGTDRSVYQYWLSGAWASTDTNNESPVKGYWYVTAVNSAPGVSRNTATLEDINGVAFSPAGDVVYYLGHYCKLSHPGVQRISSTDMASNVDALGMYYFDIECISEGYGNEWNIEPDLSSTVTGYYSEGWDVTVIDDDLSFSMAEEPWLDVIPRVLITGSDDPANYTVLVEENIQVNYEQAPIVSDVHSFVRDPQERVVCMSPLARSLFPIFVRTSVSYEGGGTETEIRSDISDLIESVLPEQELEASDVVSTIIKSGATYVGLPITLVGIKHNADRTITVERSEDTISSERLHALQADDDGTTAEGASYIALTRS